MSVLGGDERGRDVIGGYKLGNATEGRQLIPGNPDKINASVTGLRTLGAAFGRAGDGMARIDTESHWSGETADAFRAYFHGEPEKWRILGAALTGAAQALEHYPDVLRSAQADAQRAIELYTQGQKATQSARQAYNRQIADYNRAAEAYNNNLDFSRGQRPRPPAPFHDPGEAQRAQAQQILADARRAVQQAAAEATARLRQQATTLPEKPGLFSRALDALEDSVEFVGTQTAGMVEGVVEGTFGAAEGMLKMFRTVNPFDPYNRTHPVEYTQNVGALGEGIWKGVTTGQVFKDMVQWDTWAREPGRAIGTLIPALVAGAMTGGAGSAASAAADGLAGGTISATRLAAGGISKIGGTLGRGAAETAADAAEAGTVGAARLATETSVNAASHGAGMAAADARAAMTIDHAGAGLGHVERDLTQIHVHDPGTTTSSAAAPSADITPVRHPPGGDAHPPTADQPAGPTAPPIDRRPVDPRVNNPDYSDRTYEAGPKTQQAYLDQYPISHEDQSWLHYLREKWPTSANLSDSELLSLSQYAGTDASAWNTALRSGDQAELAQYDAEIRNGASALNKLPDYTGTVYRGIRVSPDNLPDLLDRYTPGRQVAEPAFTSTAQQVPFGGNVQFHINSLSGKDITPLGVCNEVLFPPGTKFNVLTRDYNAATDTWEIYLQG